MFFCFVFFSKQDLLALALALAFTLIFQLYIVLLQAALYLTMTLAVRNLTQDIRDAFVSSLSTTNLSTLAEFNKTSKQTSASSALTSAVSVTGQFFRVFTNKSQVFFASLLQSESTLISY